MKPIYQTQDLANAILKKVNKQIETVWKFVEEGAQEPENLLSMGDTPVITKNTIVMIQGKTATHKSRLSSCFASLLISDKEDFSLCGFRKDCKKPVKVIYADTERNINYQLPMAIKQIQTDTGLTLEELKDRFKIIPLATIARLERLTAIGEFFKTLMTAEDTDNHCYVIFIDIISDLVTDFNSVTETLQLSDIVNWTLNEYDVTFIVTIHENPGSVDKARGHLGTEFSNKASLTLQMANKGNNNVLSLNFIKSRNFSLPDPIFLKFDEALNNLVRVDAPEEEKYSSVEIDKLISFFKDHPEIYRITRKSLLDSINNDLKWKERKIDSILKTLIDEQIQFEDAFGNQVYLIKERAKEVFFELKKVTIPNPENQEI